MDETIIHKQKTKNENDKYIKIIINHKSIV